MVNMLCCIETLNTDISISCLYAWQSLIAVDVSNKENYKARNKLKYFWLFEIYFCVVGSLMKYGPGS